MKWFLNVLLLVPLFAMANNSDEIPSKAHVKQIAQICRDEYATSNPELVRCLGIAQNNSFAVNALRYCRDGFFDGKWSECLISLANLSVGAADRPRLEQCKTELSIEDALLCNSEIKLPSLRERLKACGH